MLRVWLLRLVQAGNSRNLLTLVSQIGTANEINFRHFCIFVYLRQGKTQFLNKRPKFSGSLMTLVDCRIDLLDYMETCQSLVQSIKPLQPTLIQ
jgi:hypothetical protein